MYGLQGVKKMPEKGEYIDFAISLDEEVLGVSYSTEMSIIIELSKKIKDLEERITELEK